MKNLDYDMKSVQQGKSLELYVLALVIFAKTL